MLWILTAGAALRLLFLTRPSLWTDEASTFIHASLPLGEMLVRLRLAESTPPLHFALTHFWLKALPDAVLGLRSFSWLCGVAALWLFWRLARALMPGRELWALALAAACPFWVHASQDGRCYALFLALSLACGLLCRRLAEEWDGPTAFAYAALAACGVMTHHFFALTVAADAAFWLAMGRRRALAALAGPALAGLALLPTLLAQRRAWPGSALLKHPMTPTQAAEIAGQMLADPWYLGLALTPWLTALGGCVLAGLLARAWSARERAAGFLFCWIHLAVPFLLVPVVEAATGTPLSQARYLIGASPYLLLLTVEAVAALRGRRRLAAGAFAGMAVAAGLAGYLYCAVFVDPRLERMAEALRRGTPRAEPIVHLHSFYYQPLRYWYLRERAHFLLDRPDSVLNAAALPGHPGAVSPAGLRRHASWAVVDPEGRLFKARIGRTAGAALAALTRFP